MGFFLLGDLMIPSLSINYVMDFIKEILKIPKS